MHGGIHQKIPDTHRRSGSCAPQAAPACEDSRARPRFWYQKPEFDYSRSHCWNEMAQSGQHGPRRHTCDCPASWPNGSPSNVQGCPSQEQRAGEGSQPGLGRGTARASQDFRVGIGQIKSRPLYTQGSRSWCWYPTCGCHWKSSQPERWKVENHVNGYSVTLYPAT